MEHFNKRKRKLRISESNTDINPEKLRSLKPFMGEDFEEYNSLPVHYKNTKNFIEVTAKPDFLPQTPEIFSNKSKRNGFLVSSDSFLLNKLSIKSFDTDINSRFKNRISKVEENIKPDLKDKKKNNKDQSNASTKKKKKQGQEVKQEQENKDKNKKKKEFTNAEDDLDTESKVNNIDVYKALQDKCFVFHMRHLTKFSFYGEIKITILEGEVEVLGYTLNSTSSSNSIDVYSPNFFTPLIVEARLPKQNKTWEDTNKQLTDLMLKEDCDKIFDNFKQGDSILLVQQILSTFGTVLNNYFDLQLFPKDLENVSSETETLKNLQSSFTFKLLKKGKYFRKNPHWDKIPLGHSTLICGGKGVGKSTLLKYYINKFVTLKEKVVCLDLDPGQPEFSFPGCITATVIDKPILGPNFTHVMEPTVMTCFGDINVALNPKKYLECVKYVIENCKNNEELQKMKWFINTMGFCKGIGIELMITILKLLQPNTVIQIKGSDRKNNYPFYLTPTAVNCKRGFGSVLMNDAPVCFDLRVIYSCAELHKRQVQGSLKPRQLRDIMALSYFSKMVSHPFYNFNAVKPYMISFSQLFLGIDYLIDPNDVLRAFNGNLVSLSHVIPESEDFISVESEGEIILKVIVKPGISSSMGIGLVRGIDCAEKKFYLMTHLPMETLKQVNCLSLGKVSPPHSMFLKQKTVECQTVYSTLGSSDIIQRVKRMFRVPVTFQTREKFND